MTPFEYASSISLKRSYKEGILIYVLLANFLALFNNWHCSHKPSIANVRYNCIAAANPSSLCETCPKMLLVLLTAVEAANLPSYLLLTATNDHHFIPLHLSSVKTSCNKGTR
jgi:hypothetical protein